MRRENLVSAGLATLLCFNILAWLAVWDLSRPQFLKVNFFNVGQGDAIFIETPQGQQILIDGGPDSAILEKLAKAMPFWDRTIDLVILTHPEDDHLTGLIEVLKKYTVKNILWTGVEKETAENAEWLKLLAKEKANIKISRHHQRVIALKTVLEILYPFEPLAEEPAAGNSFKEKRPIKNTNNTSIVSRLLFKNNSFLFTGDAEKAVEKQLIDKEINLHSDVLKVAHHGSSTSSSEEFIARVLPTIAVISVARDNPYGHPHPAVLETLKKFDIKVLRTDERGDIKIFADGKNINIQGPAGPAISPLKKSK